MKTKFLTGALALVAFLAANPASAVSLNPKGLGQVLIYPYYTVNKNQDTLISVTNVSDVGKAIYVKVLEGYNGRDTLAFNVLLSPHDIWTASISQTADDGGGVLRTSDHSCTYPTIPTDGVLLRSAAYDGTGPVPPDSGPQGITRTREGLIEMIAVGDIVPGSPTGVAITHIQNGNPGEGVPPGCAEITNTSVPADLVVPTNALYGSASIVNVGEGTYFAYNADAIAGFTSISLWGNSGTFPSLDMANSAEAVNGVARAYLSDNEGRPLTLDYTFGIDAVSAIFTSDALYNEYLVDSSLGSNTDWVVTFPTKAFYVDDLYGPQVPFPPFVEAFTDGQSNVQLDATVYDREEGFFLLVDDFPEPIAVPPALLPYEVNVISFLDIPAPAGGTPSGVFGSTLTNVNIPPYGSSGAVTLDLASGDAGGHVLPGGIDLLGVAVTLTGLPVTGFMSYNIINTQAQPGMLANYGGSFHHRATMSCIGPAEECDATNSSATGSR
jgi:hypothetical protein